MNDFILLFLFKVCTSDFFVLICLLNNDNCMSVNFLYLVFLIFLLLKEMFRLILFFKDVVCIFISFVKRNPK